jgi:hypothetical protein
MKTRLASPPVVPMEASSVLRFMYRSVIFLFGPTGHFVNILAYNLTRYYICSPYCWSYV